MTAKTDNHNLAAKLALRRHFLEKYKNPNGFSVVDCFSGGEAIWSRLRREFSVREYLALDVKEKRGRLKLDSLRYLQGEWDHDVIDLDAYGSPWRHWNEVLVRKRSCIVFLTVGSTMFRAQQKEAVAQLGITFDIPPGLQMHLEELVLERQLTRYADFGLACEHAMEAENPGGSARYFGMKLVKNDTTTA